MIDRNRKTFNVGDYIGKHDNDGSCWRVDEVTETGYVVTEVFKNVTKTIPKDYAPDEYPCLLRPSGHPDIVNFPIGSEWKIVDHSTWFVKPGDSVIITEYTWDEGGFMACNFSVGYNENACYDMGYGKSGETSLLNMTSSPQSDLFSIILNFVPMQMVINI